MTVALSQVMKPTETKGWIDQKSIGGPPEWDSNKDEGLFPEWHVKIKAWLGNQDDRALHWLNAARDADHVLEKDDLDIQHFSSDQEHADCKKFSTMLNNILVAKLKGEAFTIVSSVRDGSGFEAWRLLMKRYEPRTPGTKRALLKAIFNLKAAKKVEDIEKNVLRLEEIFNRYEVMAKEGLPEDIKTVIMIELCTPELKEHLEFNIKDVSYKETREAVMAYVERKRRDPLTAMEVGECEANAEWWSPNDYLFQDGDEMYQTELHYIGYG